MVLKTDKLAILLRQIHPCFFKKGKIVQGAFDPYDHDNMYLLTGYGGIAPIRRFYATPQDGRSELFWRCYGLKRLKPA